MRLSVIIPAWNAADTLRDCVESVVAAAAGIPVEVVVVDDGSTDGTAALASSLAGRHALLQVLSQENAGVSAARNRGLAAAKGDYVAFVDADDTLAPGSLAAMASSLTRRSAADPAVDILVARSFNGGVERYPWQSAFTEGRSYSAADLLEAGYLRGSVCGCLFRRDFLAGEGLRFPAGVSLSEDTVFFGACLAKARAISFCNTDFYHITERPGSASRLTDPGDVVRTAAAIDAAVGTISDASVRSYTLFKLILMLTSRAVRAGIPAEEASAAASLDHLLPLSLDGIGAERWKIRLLNASYPLFYRLIALRNRLR